MPFYHSKISVRENTIDEIDETDRFPSKERATHWDIAGFVISIISYTVDVALDSNLAYRYYINNELPYCYTTVGFIVFSALINTAVSFHMYMMDNKDINTGSLIKKSVYFPIILVFQLAPVLRYFAALKYALKSQKAEKENNIQNQRKYFELMIKEDTDVALLRVLECFLEAAPQQILQLTIIFLTHGKGINTLTFFHQLLSIGSSFVSMAWSMASYQRSLRFYLKYKGNISWTGTIMQFMWHFLVTVSRILCISVLASVLPEVTVLCLFLHWLLMTIWLHLVTTETNFCSNNKWNSILYAIFGLVYIFTYVPLNEGKTFKKYVLFYFLLFAENTAANVFWIKRADKELQETLYFKPIIYLNIIPFILGIIFMIVYYKFFHPNTNYGSRTEI